MPSNLLYGKVSLLPYILKPVIATKVVFLTIECSKTLKKYLQHQGRFDSKDIHQVLCADPLIEMSFMFKSHFKSSKSYFSSYH